MISFETTKRTDERLLERMAVHYSQPRGFVGRVICYAIYYDDEYYGHIVAGSATKYLQGRNEFLGIKQWELNTVINNIFYNISPVREKYPLRNFTTAVVRQWISEIARHWWLKYGDRVKGFETLIELPRTGQLYKKAGWEEVGMTKGYTCKRIAGQGSDSWTGQRIWNTEVLRPKRVLCFKP